MFWYENLFDVQYLINHANCRNDKCECLVLFEIVKIVDFSIVVKIFENWMNEIDEYLNKLYITKN